MLHKNADIKSFVNLLNHYDGSQLESSRSFPYLNVQIPLNEINRVMGFHHVKWVEYIEPDPVPDDFRGRSLHRTNAIDYPSATGLAYDGTGVSVALADDGAVGPHIDMEGRVNQVSGTASRGGHGDMTVGILLGAGNLNPEYQGMAKGATMLYYDISGYLHVYEADSNYANFGTVITSTSYSEGSGGVYTTTANEVDAQINGNPHLIHVFSAGNAGSFNYGTITGGRKAAKSTIATANLDYIGNRTNSSSRGPAQDGRVKPDIAANGTGQMSLDANNGYSPGGGTSAACPGIAGILAQMYQAYRDVNAGADPESSLMKACLLNSAQDFRKPRSRFLIRMGKG